MRNQNDYLLHLSAWLTGGPLRPGLQPSLSQWNWDRFVECAARCAVLPALQKQVSDFPPGLKVPNDISHLLATVNTLNADRNQAALAQITELAAALNQAGIQPVVLKGAANILAGIYPTIGSRYLADIDLLIAPQQFEAAIPIFLKLGYETGSVTPLELVIGHSYPPFTRSGALEVDLHRTTGLGVCAEFLPASELIQHSTIINLPGGAVVRIPSPHHLMVHHIMHSQMHDVYRERINPSLRTLYDFFLLQLHFENALNWPAIQARFRSKGQLATLALYLLQVERTLQIPAPAPPALSAGVRIRNWRRKMLQRFPVLRFFDPTYYFLAGVRPRTRRLEEILAQPAGYRYLLQKFSNAKFYQRLVSDFR